MRIHLSLLAAAALLSSVSAQSTTQYFGIDGHTTSFTSRGGISSGDGEILQGFHASHHRGLFENDGNTSPKSQITRLRVITQDQNSSTQETYDWVVRPGDDKNGPATGSAAVLGTIKGVLVPKRGNTINAWIITSTPTSPITVPFSDKFVSIGTYLGNSTGWTMDGQSNHTVFGSGQRMHANTWLDTGTSGIEHSWQIIGTATTATHPGSTRSWLYWGGTYGPIMNLGCGSTSGSPANRFGGLGGYGMGGMFPKVSGSSAPLDFVARLRGGSSMSGANSVAVLSLIPSWQIPVLVAPFGTGARLYLPNLGATFLFFGPKADANGQAVVPIAPFIPDLKNTSLATFPIQGALDSVSTGLRLTNGQAVTPK